MSEIDKRNNIMKVLVNSNTKSDDLDNKKDHLAK